MPVFVSRRVLASDAASRGSGESLWQATVRGKAKSQAAKATAPSPEALVDMAAASMPPPPQPPPRRRLARQQSTAHLRPPPEPTAAAKASPAPPGRLPGVPAPVKSPTPPPPRDDVRALLEGAGLPVDGVLQQDLSS